MERVDLGLELGDPESCFLAYQVGWAPLLGLLFRVFVGDKGDQRTKA